MVETSPPNDVTFSEAPIIQQIKNTFREYRASSNPVGHLFGCASEEHGVVCNCGNSAKRIHHAIQLNNLYALLERLCAETS